MSAFTLTGAAGRVAARLNRAERGRMYWQGYALVSSAVATSAIGIAYWAIAARLYPTAFVGLNSAAISGMLLFSGIAQLNLMGALIRFTPRAGPNTPKLVACVYATTLVAGCLVALALIILRRTWSPVPTLFDNGAPFFWWFLLSTAAWGIFALQDYVLAGIQQAIWVPIENVVFAVFKIILLVAFVRFAEYGIFFSWTIPTLAAIVLVNALLFRRLIPGHTRLADRPPEPLHPGLMARYVAGDYLGSLCVLASTTLLPILVARQLGADDAAYFYVAWIFAYGVHLVALNLIPAFTVEAAMDTGQLQALGRRVLWHMAKLVVPLALLVVLFAPFVLRIYGSSYSAHGAWTLRLLALGAIPSMITVLYVGVARVRRKTARIFTVQACICVTVLGMSHWLLGVYGIAGVGIAWLGGQSLVAAVLAMTELRPMFRPALPRAAEGPAGRAGAAS
jgi:O-antigen/teichoic acid export membrane protein